MFSDILRFIGQMFAHYVSAWGGVVLMLVAIYEKWIDKTFPKKLFFWSAVCFLIVAMFCAWRDEYTSAEWRGNENARLNGALGEKDSRISRLEGELSNKDKPIIVQAPIYPGIEKLLEGQETEMARLKAQAPSPRKKALQLSNDILKFITDEIQKEPHVPFPPMPMSVEDRQKQMQQFEQTELFWMNQIAATYVRQFSIRVSSVVDDAEAAHLDVTNLQICISPSGNTYMIQQCGARIGALAQKLPQ